MAVRLFQKISLPGPDGDIYRVDISGKADKGSIVSNVSYDKNNRKLVKTIDGETTDIFSAIPNSEIDELFEEI